MTTATPEIPSRSLLRLANPAGPSGVEPAGAPDPSPQRIGMTALDRLAVTSFAGCDAAVVIEQVVARATAICDERDFGATDRMLARRIAATEATIEVIDTLIGKSVIGRDFESVGHLERLSRTYALRLVRLIEAHSLHRRLSRRAAVTDGDTVIVR